MPLLTFRTRIDAPAETVFQWHERPGALQRLSPPWAPVEVERADGIRDGNRAVMRVGFGPMRVKWVAEHRDYVAGRQFKDVQVQGPFSRWEHTHRFIPEGPEVCLLEDHLEYDLPLGKVGEELAEDRLRKELRRQFAYRHRVLRQDLAVHARYNRRPLIIAITGASGLIGSSLVPFLTTGGHRVVRLVRSEPGEDEVYWNYRENRIEAEELEGVDAVIHLAGENLFHLRWSEQKKTRILQSRARGTRLIAETLAKLKQPPAVFISASAVGYYGDRSSEVLTEESGPGDDSFLSVVTQEWERATLPASEAGIRTVNARMGVVMSPAGGALQLMLPVFRMGLGGHVGERGQYFSWIALEDAVYALYHALWTGSLHGPVNFAAPNPVPMADLTKTVARVLEKPVFFKAPTALLRMVSGEAADELILSSQRVHPEQLLRSGYTFAYPELAPALRHQLGEEDD